MNNPTRGLSRDQCIQMYRKMLEIRKFEDKVQDLFEKKIISGTTHLASGQEAITVGVSQALNQDDYVTCTYRGHGVLISRGSNIDQLMAELLGKATGICKGKGGSMHLTDFQVGVIGSFAIVGEGLPVAVGAALSSRMRNTQQVAVTFFGEGSTNIGTFHESMNLASIWKLPVIFVCENNLYGEYTPVSKSTPINDVARRASSYAIEGVIVDGNQILDVYSATLNAVLKARTGEGPTMIECKTYRQRGHSRTDTGAYRPKEEVEYWLKRDPINLFRELLRRMSYLDDDLDAELTDSTSRTIEQAAKFAIESPWPGSSEACDSVYGNRLE